jgi:hypothetical protein
MSYERNKKGKYFFYLMEKQVMGQSVSFENRLKAERAWFLDRRERRAKPETEQALPRWGKACVFSKHPA